MLAANTVLIIDDELDSCLLWTAFLSQLNFKVFTAVTLAEGLRLVDEVKPSVIFLDNNLPDGLGWDQVDFILERLPGCRINLVSAYGYDSKKWLRDDVHIIEKPVTLSHIKTLLY